MYCTWYLRMLIDAVFILISQDETETVREELTFKDHRISELESALCREKEMAAGLESETHVMCSLV